MSDDLTSTVGVVAIAAGAVALVALALALVLMTRIKRACGVKLSTKALYDRRTIRGLDDVEEQLKLPVLGVIPKKNP